MTNPYGCPPRIYAKMDDPLCGPVLVAVKKIGPDRVKWSGDDMPKSRGNLDSTMPTCWRMVGMSENMTYSELYAFASELEGKE